MYLGNLDNPFEQISAQQRAMMLELQRSAAQQGGLQNAAQGLSSPNAPMYAANPAQQPQPNPVLLLLEDV